MQIFLMTYGSILFSRGSHSYSLTQQKVSFRLNSSIKGLPTPAVGILTVVIITHQDHGPDVFLSQHPKGFFSEDIIKSREILSQGESNPYCGGALDGLLTMTLRQELTRSNQMQMQQRGPEVSCPVCLTGSCVIPSVRLLNFLPYSAWIQDTPLGAGHLLLQKLICLLYRPLIRS